MEADTMTSSYSRLKLIWNIEFGTFLTGNAKSKQRPRFRTNSDIEYGTFFDCKVESEERRQQREQVNDIT